MFFFVAATANAPVILGVVAGLWHVACVACHMAHGTWQMAAGGFINNRRINYAC